MGNFPELRICALGPARVWRGAHELTSKEWTWTKAKELFFFLLSHTPRPKPSVGQPYPSLQGQTREQIGLALTAWGLSWSAYLTRVAEEQQRLI